MKDSLWVRIRNGMFGWWVRPVCYLLMYLVRNKRLLISMPEQGILLEPIRVQGLLLRPALNAPWRSTVVLDNIWDEQTRKVLEESKERLKAALHGPIGSPDKPIKKGDYIN